MRSLSVKLTLAFLIVGLTGAILVAVLVHQSTRTAFDQFIFDQGRQDLAEDLQVYYSTHGSWDGLAEALRQPPQFGAGREGLRSLRRLPDHATLVDRNGVVVISDEPKRIGAPYQGVDLNQGIALVVNGETVGWLAPEGKRLALPPAGPEDAFLIQVNRAAFFSALAAAGLALLLGGLLAYSLTRSLRELTDATGQIARGNLGLQVKVRSRDEVGVLATAFNKMSADLQRATQARRQMTADIAHDLRSPLSVISGYAEALSDGKLPGTPEIYDVLYQETHRLSGLVDDLRLLSLADAGELRLELQPVAPQALLERTAIRHAVTAQQKGIRLELQVEPGLPDVPVDEERMAQVLDNLVLNAFRYTGNGLVTDEAHNAEPGVVTLAARSAPVTVGAHGVRPMVCLQVRDNGSGISAEDLPHIFDRFYRADKSRSHSGESGLGLAIARSIVEAHGGTISVESKPGEGTAFTIWFPTKEDVKGTKGRE